MFLKLLILATFIVLFSHCANILGIMPTPSFSHQVVYAPLWKELSLRGHKVTAITTNPVNDPKLVNLTEIDISFVYEYFANISELAESQITMWNIHDIFSEFALLFGEAILSFPPVQELLHNKTFDVVLVEFIYPEFLNFGKLYDCPTVIISSFDALALFHRALGNPSYTSLYPEIGSPFSAPLDFMDRVINTVHNWYTWYHYKYVSYPKRDELLKRYLNTTARTEELINEVDMMFLNVNPAIQTVRPVGPTTISIGGYREPASSKPPSKDLQDFLDEATDGFIYFSLGSNVKSKSLAGPIFTAIFETLTEMPLRVLWKFEDDSLPRKPDHIKLIKWAPQEQVLSHPNIKVFVTQGGLQSLEEGIYREVPFVIIPFFADQEHNSKLMKNKGIARIVQRKPLLDKEELKSAILEVINNPSSPVIADVVVQPPLYVVC
ncbi:hypothetical protein NQ318_021876 [Aromia moschata]|uniref:UDP-glucuronosyltransferase n=1 Tax=Aromia moschata TaxID=1265417 RepID=A0AAV8Z6F4_9CUCU|nr:hypothetical protein NQ318_021876 [Aromia moschata]